MKNNIKDIASLSVNDIQERIVAERTTLQKLKFAHAITPIENPARIRASRKLIAQLTTELTARRVANAK